MTAPTTTTPTPARYVTDVQLCRRCHSSFEDADPAVDLCDDCALGVTTPRPAVRQPEWLRRSLKARDERGFVAVADITGSVTL